MGAAMFWTCHKPPTNRRLLTLGLILWNRIWRHSLQQSDTMSITFDLKVHLKNVHPGVWAIISLLSDGVKDGLYLDSWKSDMMALKAKTKPQLDPDALFRRSFAAPNYCIGQLV